MNAQNEEEKLAINTELKAYYATLNNEDKDVFNQELQSFLIKEMSSISSVYNAARDN